MDLGRKPEARFSTDVLRFDTLGDVTAEDLNEAIRQLQPFNTDNRSGIERTLHRISAMRNRAGNVVGLTFRVGRAVVGTIQMVQDLIETGQSVLFLGRPGIGKTTVLRETARVLADELQKRVIVVDTSNEIGGDGDIPHPGIGFARRMQVPSPDRQHAVMIEAVENHMPEVIIVDEIGTEAEALAARTIAQRGVQLIATAHGNTLDNLLKNPTLSDLVGGVQSVILGDEEAKFRGTQKTVLERKSLPTFDVLIEFRSRDEFAVYSDVRDAVDTLLRKEACWPELRRREPTGNVTVQQPISTGSATSRRPAEMLKVFPYGLKTDYVLNAIATLEVPAAVANTMDEADIVLTIKSKVGAKSKIQQLTQGRQVPTHVLSANKAEDVKRFFRRYFKLSRSDEEAEEEALRDIHRVCQIVADEKKTVEAAPTTAHLRRLQHAYVDSLHLNSISIGEEPNCRVRVYPR